MRYLLGAPVATQAIIYRNSGILAAREAGGNEILYSAVGATIMCILLVLVVVVVYRVARRTRRSERVNKRPNKESH